MVSVEDIAARIDAAVRAHLLSMHDGALKKLEGDLSGEKPPEYLLFLIRQSLDRVAGIRHAPASGIRC